MGNLRTLTGSERYERLDQYRRLMARIKEGEGSGQGERPVVGEAKSIEILATAITAMEVIEDVITLGNDLLLVGSNTPVFAVAHAFNEEISKAIRGQR